MTIHHMPIPVLIFLYYPNSFLPHLYVASVNIQLSNYTKKTAINKVGFLYTCNSYRRLPQGKHGVSQ